MGLTSDTNEIMSFKITGSWQKAFGDNMGFDDFRIASVPEPATIAMLGLGGLGLLRKRKSA